MLYVQGILTLVLLAASSAATARTLVISADVWCPYNCEAISKDRGFMVDAAAEILEKQGYTIEYHTNAWTRAVQDVTEGRIDAVVGASAPEAKDLIIADEPLAMNKTCFFTRGDDKFTYKGVPSLDSIRIGVISGYQYGGEIDNYIRQNRANYQKVQFVSGDKPLLQNIHKLDGHRIDALVENDMVMEFSSRKFRVKGLRNGGCDKPGPLFIAFSPKIPDARRLAEFINAGLPEMRRSGRFGQILERYGVRDWR